MGESTAKLVKGIVYFVLFSVFVALVIVGQRNIGLSGLLTGLVGLAGLLVLLYLYNRQYQ